MRIVSDVTQQKVARWLRPLVTGKAATEAQERGAEDVILYHFFQKERWQAALDKCVGKDMRYAPLRRLASPQARVALCRDIVAGRYEIAPPRSVLIPKEGSRGEYREVYVSADEDRLLLGIANDLLFDLMPEMVHPACKSYQRGTGTGKVVRHIAQVLSTLAQDAGAEHELGWKADLSKYFDSVPLELIDAIFDQVEAKWGRSALVALIRRHYHSQDYVDRDGVLGHKYMSLRQGCAVSAFLADAVLYGVDSRLAALDGYYVRYSDDMLFLGPDSRRAMDILTDELARMGLCLNPRKVSAVRADRWFTFLGFSIRGSLISISPSQLKTFQREVLSRTVRKARTPQAAARAVQRYLYVGNGKYSWATRVLQYINAQDDIQALSVYVMDALRATATGHRRIGALAYDPTGKAGCVRRTLGRNVTSGRATTPQQIEGYRSLACMKRAMSLSKPLYEAMLRDLQLT